jgi:hypothetical protein
MNSLTCGCAAVALLAGLAVQAHAQTVVREAPVHAVPVDEDDGLAAETAAPAVKPEPAPVKALAPPAPALTPEENAFFTALGQRVTDAASAYESYVRRAGGIDPVFSGAASVHRAVQLGAAYHPHQLEEGIVAYAALIALRNPDFVDGVRGIQNPAFADGLADHPERVMQVRGAPAAAADAAGVLRSQGEALIAAGKAVTKAAYDIQAQPWSKSPVADPNGVLDEAKTSAGETRTATIPSKERLLDSLVAAPALQTGDAVAGPAPDVVRGVALAALAILGRTGDGKEAQFQALLDDPASAQCLKLAKLNLNQCLAVAGPQYEDAYCAGRHAVSDTGKCVAAAGGGGPALDAAPQPKALEAEAIGPEQAAAYGKPAPKDDDADAVPPAPAPAPAPALAAASPTAPSLSPAQGPRQYAQVAPAYAQPQLQQPQLQQPQPQPYAYARNDYAQPPAYQPPAYPQQSYPPQAYPQPQYQYQSQPYPQPQYAPQPYAQGYASQPYAQPRTTYAPTYGSQPYYPQQSYYPGSYYGR